MIYNPTIELGYCGIILLKIYCKEEKRMNNNPICPTCGKIMVVRKGALGEFYGCTGYPNCTTTVNLSDVDEKFGEVTNYNDGESYGICNRCEEKDTLSDMGLCSYCQHVWDND